MTVINVTTTQFGTGGSVQVALDTVTSLPSAVIITPDVTHGLRYSVTCAGTTQAGVAAAGGAPVVLTVVAVYPDDLTDVTVDQV